MASLLETLQAKGLSLDDARNAMGLEPGATFNYLGEQVPTETPPSPLATPVAPGVPNALTPSTPQSYTSAPQEVSFPQETLTAERPQSVIKKHNSSDYATREKAAMQKLSDLPEAKEDAQTAAPATTKQEDTSSAALPTQQPQGRETEATRENLLAAQQQAKDSEVGALWGKLGARIGGALGHQSKDVIAGNEGIADAIAKIGSHDKQDLMERIALEKQDPNSRYSMAAKQFIKDKFHVDIPEGISVEELDKTFMAPALKSFEAEELRKSKHIESEDKRRSDLFKMVQEIQARKDIQSQRGEDRLAQIQASQAANAPMREMMMQMRQQSIDDKNTRQASQQLEQIKNKAISGGGPAGNQIRNKIQFSDNLFGTVGADSSMSEQDVDKMPAATWDKIPRPMVAETAVELNRLLNASGQAPQGTLAKLIPSNILMDATQVKDYVTSKLNPADQGEFVKQALKTAARIKTIGKSQNKDLMSKYFAGTERIKKQAPDDYTRALTELGLDPADFEGPKKKGPKLNGSLMDKIPNSGALQQKFDNVNGMSEEQLDAEMKRLGIK